MRRVVFTGYYGQQNFGDDVFAMTCALAANRYWDVAAEILGPPLEFDAPARFAVKRGAAARRWAASGPLGRAARLVHKTAALRPGTTLVYGGGSVLGSSGVLDARRLGVAASRAGLVRLGAVGVSVGPFARARDRAAVHAALRRFRFLAVRDAASWREVSAMELPYSPVEARDLAALLPRLVPATQLHAGAEPSSRPRLGVALCEYERFVGGDAAARAAEQRVIEQTIEGVRRFAGESGWRVRLLVLNTHPTLGDDRVTARAAAALQGVAEVDVVRRSDAPLATWRAIAGCDAVLSFRLHGAIAAFVAGVPAALYEYHRKCADFVADVGMPAALRLPKHAADAASVSAVLHALARGGARPAVTPKAYADMAERNFSGTTPT